MRKTIIMDEFHVTVYAASQQTAPTYRAIARALNNKKMHKAFRLAVRGVFRQFPPLDAVRVKLTR